EYAIEGMGNATDLKKRHGLEERMNETLGWTGLGLCDGGSIGSGTMEVCCYVVDFQIAKDAILMIFKILNSKISHASIEKMNKFESERFPKTKKASIAGRLLQFDLRIFTRFRRNHFRRRLFLLP
ncbi:MAG TPA: hypothetical protein VGH42_05860, partial [Verrucomicrobiae bacterium]